MQLQSLVNKDKHRTQVKDHGDNRKCISETKFQETSRSTSADSALSAPTSISYQSTDKRNSDDYNQVDILKLADDEANEHAYENSRRVPAKSGQSSLNNVLWVAFQDHPVRKHQRPVNEAAANRRKHRADSPRPRTRRGPARIIRGLSQLGADDTSRKKLEAVAEIESEINEAIEKIADKLLVQGLHADSRHGDVVDSVVTNARRAKMNYRLPPINNKKKKKASFGIFDDYIANIENLIEIQACKNYFTDSMLGHSSNSLDVHNEVMCSACRLNKDLLAETRANHELSDFRQQRLFYEGEIRNIKNEYSDEVTNDVDRIIDEIENNWWYC